MSDRTHLTGANLLIAAAALGWLFVLALRTGDVLADRQAALGIYVDASTPWLARRSSSGWPSSKRRVG